MSSPSSSFERPQTQEDNRPAHTSFVSTSPANSSKSGSSLPSQSHSILHHVTEGGLGEEYDGVERHPKGKRKRTAAEDKEILESAYNANPKPDKAARLDVVNRVSLTEKEVQIWFQNRRQNDRRKSRPLSPQEVAALHYGGMQILSSDPISYTQSSVADHEAESSPQHHDVAFAPQSSTPLASPDLGPWLPGRFELMLRQEPRGESEQRMGSPSAVSDTSMPKPIESADNSCNLSRSFPGAVGYLSNRWNVDSSFTTPSSSFSHAGPEESPKMEFSFAPASCPATVSAPILPPPNPQKKFRLSMSLDGKAEVINGKSPSPIRFQSARPEDPVEAIPLPQLRRPSLQRSHSAFPAVTLPPISTLTAQWPSSRAAPPRLHRGRSRDVLAWEFACDAENREDELTVQAKEESNGSAIAAISLLRSSSSVISSGILQPNGSKRNSPAAPRAGAAKRTKLGRASGSIARLHSEPEKRDVERVEAVDCETDGKKRRRLKVTSLLSPSGDSDKENWSPDEDGHPVSVPTTTRRPLPSSAQQSGRDDKSGVGNPRRTLGRVLQDHAGGPVFLGGSSRANTAPVGRRRGGKASALGAGGLEIFEDEQENQGGEGGGAEVERFMQSEGINISPSKKGDMDCIAGLLSLSQGNWR